MIIDSELRFRGENPSNDLNSLIDADSNDHENKKKLTNKQQQTRSQWESTLSLENICWLIASGACLYFTDILNVILWDERINKKLLFSAFSFISINIIIGSYLIIYLTNIKKIPSSKWSECNPYLIPIATGAFIFGSILYYLSLKMLLKNSN